MLCPSDEDGTSEFVVQNHVGISERHNLQAGVAYTISQPQQWKRDLTRESQHLYGY